MNKNIIILFLMIFAFTPTKVLKSAEKIRGISYNYDYNYIQRFGGSCINIYADKRIIFNYKTDKKIRLQYLGLRWGGFLYRVHYFFPIPYLEIHPEFSAGLITFAPVAGILPNLTYGVLGLGSGLVWPYFAPEIGLKKNINKKVSTYFKISYLYKWYYVPIWKIHIGFSFNLQKKRRE